MSAELLKELGTLLDAGFKILPCREFTKIPKIPGWPEKASNDMAQIADWLTWGPCNWAVLVEDGMFVIDCENMEPGFEVFLPETLECKTPRGGRHYYYQGDVKDIALRRIVSGVEVYGPGRTVMVPPSVIEPSIYHSTSEQGAWKWRSSATFPIAKAPDYLIERILKK